MFDYYSKGLLNKINCYDYPPPQKTTIDLPIILHIKQVYKILHHIETTLPKQHKLGIHHAIECMTIEILEISIETVLRPRTEKHAVLYIVRRKVEALKHLVRTERELSIISEKQYIRLASLLMDISMMATGWQKSVLQNPTQKMGGV